jgi:hypothetical protein
MEAPAEEVLKVLAPVEGWRPGEAADVLVPDSGMT